MKTEKPFSLLENFLPPNTYPQVIEYFRHHTIHLTLTRERKSVLGDYRNPTRSKPYHQISINATLNPYSFLITLLHELAHLMVFNQFHHSVAPHGAEWKLQFSSMLKPYLGKQFFPPDVERAIVSYINNPKASTCTDANLYKALYNHSEKKQGYTLVENIQPNQKFMLENGNVFTMLDKRRTRYRCREEKTGKIYLFQGIYEVQLIGEG